MSYRLLEEFRGLFEGKAYKHRRSNLGDWVAMHLYEDLYQLDKSSKLRSRIEAGDSVLNVQNQRIGIRARRGDGTFGEAVPGLSPMRDPGFAVQRAAIATVEIGAEVKILAKAMIKQIDRVIGDLQRQAAQFRTGGGEPICVAIVGINRAPVYTGYEGERRYATDGKTHRHPAQEAEIAERRIADAVSPHYDELILLRFMATNQEPFPFKWVDQQGTFGVYGAALTRISREYDRRF